MNRDHVLDAACIVAALKPGATTAFPIRSLDDAAVDQVMAAVPGSDRCINVFHDLRMRVVRFTRLEPLADDDPRSRYVPMAEREAWRWDGEFWVRK